MKWTIALLLFLLSGNCLRAQDTIRKITGVKIAAEIRAVKVFEVIYSKPDWPEGTTKRISRSEIADIRYADGHTDTFFNISGKTLRTHARLFRADSMYLFGRKDAAIFYSNYEGAAAGTLLATFPGSPLAGLITACAASGTPPKDKNLQFPNGLLAGHPDYYEGYRKKAWSMKRARVWTNFGIGVGLTGVALLILESLKTSAH